MVLQTLAGLAARAAAKGQSREMIWYPINHPAYQRWFEAMLRQTGARVEGPYEIWELADRFRQRDIVKGYVLYRFDDSQRHFYEPGKPDTSLNVATALCAHLGAVAVSENLEEAARQQGLPLLSDARSKTEAECFAEHRGQFSRRVLALQDPKVPEIRAEAVALGAFVLSQPGPLYEQALEWLEPDSPILGWGIGDEAEVTLPSSCWGHFQTATNWCLNLPLLSTERTGVTFARSKLRPRRRSSLWGLSWEDDVHYVSFVMSDGDNVQWLMGNFMEDESRCWWANSYRGQKPMGWTVCYTDLAQLCPYALEYLFRTAKPRDDFILLSGGYYYPDFFGTRRVNCDVLRLHLSRMADYMRMGGLGLLMFNAQKWDSAAAVAAYATSAAEIPGLLGILVVQYAPYTAGGGATRWVKACGGDEVPVISTRFALWNNANRPRDGSPAKIAALVNAMPHHGVANTVDHFSWVVVHAWSWFKDRGKGSPPEAEETDQSLGGQPKTGRGLTAVKWCAEALQPHVRVVTPTEIVLLMRLRLRPRQTLVSGLRTLRERWNKLRSHRASSPGARSALSEAGWRLGLATQRLENKEYHDCFEQGKSVSKLLERAASSLGEGKADDMRNGGTWRR